MRWSWSFEKVGTAVYAFFIVLDGNNNRVSGLSTVDFTFRFFNPAGADIAGSTTITVTELASTGAYYSALTLPAGEGEYSLEVNSATYFVSGKRCTFLAYINQYGDAGDPTAQMDFFVEDGDGNRITGLTSVDFSWNIWDPTKTEVSGSVSVTFDELGAGNYRAQFDASSVEGDWFFDLINSTYFPAGKIGVYKYIEPSSEVSDPPSILSAVNDLTGTSATLTFVAADPLDEIFTYYRVYPLGAWSLFGSTRVGSGDLQITGLSNNQTHEFIAVASQSGSATENQSAPSNPARVFVTDGVLIFMAIRQALYDWVVSQVPYSVIWIPSNAPMPTPPFVSLRIKPTERIGMDSHSAPDEVTGDETLQGDREFMLEIQVYGDLAPQGMDAAMQYAEQIATSLQKFSVLSTLEEEGIAPVTVLPLVDLTSIGRTQFESRVMVEARFRIGWETTDNVGVIETSDAPTGTVD